MAGQDRAGQSGEGGETQGRPSFDKSQSAPRGGSVAMVLLVALFLVVAAGGLGYVGRDHAGTYIAGLLAFLGTIGVFALFGAAAGILRWAGRDASHPLLKAVVDNSPEGILVTDHAGRVFYANATYLDLTGAAGVDAMK